MKNDTILRIASSRDASPGQVLIAWALTRGTSVIPKSVNPSRIRENWRALEVTLNDADMEAIAALDASERMIRGDFWYLHESYTPSTLWGD